MIRVLANRSRSFRREPLQRILSAFAIVLLIDGCAGPQTGALPSSDSAAAWRQSGAPLVVGPPGSKERVLHDFEAGADGAGPYAGLVNVNGTLYGTTVDGGANGYGTVFKVTTSGRESVLYSFTGGSDGGYPYGGLIDVKGVLYGTSSGGGVGCYSGGCGTVFRITTSGKESVVYSFNGGASDGAYPEAGLTDVSGTFYGTTSGGGRSSFGTVFKVTNSGKETLLHSFAGGADGATPVAGLTNLNGALYGTTEVGGSGSCSGFQGDGCGTVFKVTGSGTESVLFTFPGNESNGEFPFAGLAAVKSALYGTTLNGGTSNIGVVFEITPSGKESVLYNFKNSAGDGNEPYAGLLDIKGVLYGTTGQGGSAYHGTVFKITLSGTETLLYSFAGYPADGAAPVGSLTELGGRLYGTTEQGGNSKDCYTYFGPVGCGTIFSLSL